MSRTKRMIAPALALALSTGAARAAADFTRYVAVGDSLTAAYCNGGLVETVQVNSYPALIHLQATGSDVFEQPLVSEPGIAHLWTLDSLIPVVINTYPSGPNGSPLNLTLPRPYDNLAVPGTKTRDVVATTSSATNPYYGLILRGLGTQLAQAVSLEPTFASVWIGNNDVLAAALGGRVIEGVTLTPRDAFQADFVTILDALTGAGADLVVGTIPDVTAIPYVTTLPWFIVDPSTGDPVLDEGGNPVPFIGPDGPLGSGDFVLLSAGTHLKQGYGLPPGICPIQACPPLADSDVLSAAEAEAIRTRTGELNAVITGLADSYGYAVADIHALFADIKANGLRLGGVLFTSNFLTGGLFGYDGVHPTPLGNGILANTFIAAIDRKYGNGIPYADLTDIMFNGLPGGGGAPTGTVTSTYRMSPEAVSALFRAMNIPTDPSSTGGNNKPRKKMAIRKGPAPKKVLRD